MKRKFMKTTAIGMAAMMMAGLFAGCGASADQDATASDKNETTEASASGTISLAGSTSMEKLCEAMSEGFMEAYPDITVTVEYTGSGAGIGIPSDKLDRVFERFYRVDKSRSRDRRYGAGSCHRQTYSGDSFCGD